MLQKLLWFPKNKLKGLSTHLNFFFRLETFSKNSATCSNKLPPLSSLFLCPQFTLNRPSWKFNLLSQLFGLEHSFSRAATPSHSFAMIIAHSDEPAVVWRENWWMSRDLMRNEMHKVKLLGFSAVFPPFRRHYTSPARLWSLVSSTKRDTESSLQHSRTCNFSFRFCFLRHR